MSDKDKYALKIKLARTQGEYIGTLKAIVCWDIPEELKHKLIKLIDKLED